MHGYSILVRDPVSRQFAVVVQSHWFAVVSTVACTWAVAPPVRYRPPLRCFRPRASVRGKAAGPPWDDHLIALQVEDHPTPVFKELKRLLRIHSAHRHMNLGEGAL